MYPLSLLAVLIFALGIGCGHATRDLCRGSDNDSNCTPNQITGYDECLSSNGYIYGSPMWNAYVNQCQKTWRVYP